MNILIPCAGAGRRFEEVGYTFPKPLIEVFGKPMIQRVVENLACEGRHIFIVQKDHYERYALNYLLPLIAPGCEIVTVDHVTQGAACTTLLAKKFIDNKAPLIIANSDQLVEWEEPFDPLSCEVDGAIWTFEGVHPKWSFTKVENGKVVEVAEKKPISNRANVGIFYWRHGEDYVKYSEQMIKKDIRVNNEYYVAPVFNEAIADGKEIVEVPVRKMWGLGDPESLRYYLANYKE